jgi:two-component system sensor histidine kinase PhoQ
MSWTRRAIWSGARLRCWAERCRFFPAVRNPGDTQFAPLEAVDGPAVRAGLYRQLGSCPNQYQLYTFRVAETQWNYLDQLWSFRRSLWGWLLAATGVLLAVQGLILRWSLKPLRRVATEVTEIEVWPARRTQRRLSRGTAAADRQPERAASPGSHALLERYRNALADLAHSLKTPLAVLRGALENGEPPKSCGRTLIEQVERMNRTVDYQLQRAAASGPIALSAPLPVAPLARKIQDSLAKVYADRALSPAQRSRTQTTMFYGDEGDLMEILGNLADNACKWCRRRVVVRAWPADRDGPRNWWWRLRTMDPAFPPNRRRCCSAAASGPIPWWLVMASGWR